MSRSRRKRMTHILASRWARWPRPCGSCIYARLFALSGCGLRGSMCAAIWMWHWERWLTCSERHGAAPWGITGKPAPHEPERQVHVMPPTLMGVNR